MFKIARRSQRHKDAIEKLNSSKARLNRLECRLKLLGYAGQTWFSQEYQKVNDDAVDKLETLCNSDVMTSLYQDYRKLELEFLDAQIEYKQALIDYYLVPHRWLPFVIERIN